MADQFPSMLDPQVTEKLMAVGAPRTYPARSYVFYEGDPGSGVLIVESGLLRIDRTTQQGRIVLLNLASKGDLIGELSVIDGAARSATLSTVTDSVLHYVPSDAFRTMLRDDPLVQTEVLLRLARRVRGLSTQFLETATMDATARIASRLMRLVEIEQSLGRAHVGSDGQIDLKLPISQEELGHWAGLSREGAVKGLSTLRSVGLIKTGRKRVYLLKPEELANMAE